VKIGTLLCQISHWEADIWGFKLPPKKNKNCQLFRSIGANLLLNVGEIHRVYAGNRSAFGAVRSVN